MLPPGINAAQGVDQEEDLSGFLESFATFSLYPVPFNSGMAITPTVGSHFKLLKIW